MLTDVVHDYIHLSPQWKGQVEGDFDWQLLQAGEGPGHSSGDPGPGGRGHGGTARCVPRRHEGDVRNTTAVDRSEWFQGIQLLLSHLIQLDFADHMLVVLILPLTCWPWPIHNNFYNPPSTKLKKNLEFIILYCHFHESHVYGTYYFLENVSYGISWYCVSWYMYTE